MSEKKKEQIKKLRKEFHALGKGKYNLGGKGMEILSKIHRLELEEDWVK